MKKIILFAVLLLVSSVFTFSQEFKPYVSFRPAYSYSSDSGNGFSVQGEYGWTYKWLNAGVALEYSSNKTSRAESESLVFSGGSKFIGFEGKKVDEYFGGLSLHAAVDVVRIFTDKSNHAVKVGAKAGVANYAKISKSSNTTIEHYSIMDLSGIDYFLALDFAYKYALSEHISVGAFCESNTNSRSSLGLVISRRF